MLSGGFAKEFCFERAIGLTFCASTSVTESRTASRDDKTRMRRLHLIFILRADMTKININYHTFSFYLLLKPGSNKKFPVYLKVNSVSCVQFWLFRRFERNTKGPFTASNTHSAPFDSLHTSIPGATTET